MMLYNNADKRSKIQKILGSGRSYALLLRFGHTFDVYRVKALGITRFQ